MKKANLLPMFLFGAFSYGQVGVNTTSPKATLDITAKNPNGSTPEGVMVPRLTGSALHTADTNGVYGQTQDGTMVFVIEPPIVGDRVGQTLNINERGYYYYDYPSNQWKKWSSDGNSQGGVVSSLDCGDSKFSPGFIGQLQPYSGTLTISYTNGNGQGYSQQSFASNGLTFFLPSGTLKTGNGELIYLVTGSAGLSGTMTIPISFGGISCDISKTVASSGTSPQTVNMCGKIWMTHNLGADRTVDPDNMTSPNAWALNGAYIQWGKRGPLTDWRTIGTDGNLGFAAAPSGSSEAESNSGATSGWNTTPASNGSWGATKTVNDPCPEGFRVPTKSDWEALVDCSATHNGGNIENTPTTWGTASNTQYGNAKVFSNGTNKLTLPATGLRSNYTGALNSRGRYGDYWSSTEGSTSAYTLEFDSSTVNPAANYSRTAAFSVRCIAE